MTDPAQGSRDITGYVLAGGRSSRMGQDKALLEIDGQPLLEHALRTLRPVSASVAILSGPSQFERDALLSRYERLVPDADTAHAGPLAALSAALADCGTQYALLLAVDQPAISSGALVHLAHAATSSQVAACCFLHDGRPEPLPLLVSRDLRPGILQALQAGERRLLPTVEACAAQTGRGMLYLSAPIPGQFTNLNTPADLRRWREQAFSNQSAGSASETKNG